jgi:uncharacterized protein (DUF2236 family)
LLTSASVARRINGERLVLLGWSRAILMQLAHPLVAAGVTQYSTFRGNAAQAVMRLHQTVGAMLALTFGDRTRRAAAIAHIREIHRQVNGALPETVGQFRAGTRYSAEDPELLLWVHATLLDSTVDIYQRLVGPLTRSDLDEYCADSMPTLVDLGGDAATAPRTWDDLTAYMTRIEHSGVLAVTPPTRALADQVLSPHGAAWAVPLGALNQVITIGLLPPWVRAVYGYAWDDAREARFTRAMNVIRAVRRAAPARMAQWRDARR